MAGEIVAVGEDVKGWKQGDRVCANFATDHIYGETNAVIQRTALGGPTHGVLTEYRTFPAHVRTLCSEDETTNTFRLVTCRNPGSSFL
jgi:NADPH:quinone reductase-like Zn-dependent oxidoreductase